MHVRTAYLPEIGSPLVCRFEHDGQEIVVEGQVAWREEADLGGEFGIKFTALDSGSVDALRELCGLEGAEEAPAPEATQESSPAAATPDRGARVRLHIEGLGSPMKASVRDGTHRKMQVSSNLEFLKVGRQLEFEELSSGSRRPAQIHGVDVVIDPTTRVPQLVVALRFDDGEETTPEPSVIDAGLGMTPRSPVHPAKSFAAPEPASEHAGSADSDRDLGAEDDFGPEPTAAPAQLADEESVLDDAGRMQDRLSSVAAGAGVAAKKTGAVLASAGSAAAGGMGRFFRGAAAKLGEMRKNKQRQAAPKRTTAAPPSGVLSADGRRLRPQSATGGPATTKSPEPQAKASKLAQLRQHPKAKKVAGLSALLVLVTTVSVIAMKKPAPPPGDEPAADAVSTTVAADVTSVDEEGNPIAAVKTAPAAAPVPAAPTPLSNAPEPSGDGITADVPLFGPTPMATMEPAPLGPAPGADGVIPEADDEESTEKAAAAEVEDESWSDKSSAKDKPAKKANPSDVKPWGRGRLKLPTIHRLRLDAPGGAIKGAVNPTGFTVVVPGVKVMESAKGIEKRDDRIARVKVRNGSYGAEITFQFRENVPGYRVRLRKDLVEFLISAPEEGKLTSSKKSAAKSKKKASQSGKSDATAASKSGATTSKKKKATASSTNSKKSRKKSN